MIQNIILIFRFSLEVPYHLVQQQLGEFVSMRLTFLVDHFINSYDLYVSCKVIFVRKKLNGDHY